MSIAKYCAVAITAGACGIIQAMSSRDDARDKRTKYETVPLSELRQGRLGKHYELVQKISRQLEELPEGEAVKIPLASVNGL